MDIVSWQIHTLTLAPHGSVCIVCVCVNLPLSLSICCCQELRNYCFKVPFRPGTSDWVSSDSFEYRPTSFLDTLQTNRQGKTLEPEVCRFEFELLFASDFAPLGKCLISLGCSFIIYRIQAVVPVLWDNRLKRKCKYLAEFT